MARHGVRRVELRRNLERLRAKRARGYITQPLDRDDPQVLMLRRLGDATQRLARLDPGAPRAALEVLDLARFVSGLERGLIVLADTGGRRFFVRATRGLEAATPDERDALETAAAQALRRRASCLDRRPRPGVTPAGLLVALLLERDGRVVGALALHGRLRGAPLTRVEATLLGAFARQAGLTLAAPPVARGRAEPA